MGGGSQGNRVVSWLWEGAAYTSQLADIGPMANFAQFLEHIYLQSQIARQRSPQVFLGANGST